MRNWRLFMVALVFLCAGVACTNSANQASSSSNALIQQDLATATPTLTPTPSPTPTAIPSVLGALPDVFSETDISAVHDNYVFQITQMRELSLVGSRRPNTNKRFIEISGYVYNYSNEPITLHDIDFDLAYELDENAVTVQPSSELLAILKTTEKPNLEYPDRNLAFYSDFVVPAKTAKATLLIYEVDSGIDLYRLAFISDQQNLEIIGLPIEGDNEYLVYKVDTRASLDVEFDVDRIVSRITKVIDVNEDVVVDNCFGTETITRTVSYTQEETTQLLIEDEQRLRLSFGRLPIIGRLIRADIRNRHQTTEGISTTKVHTESLSASPGTRPRWKLRWYYESLDGVMLLRLGDDVFEIPYTVKDRLRSELISIPSVPCS